jgi:RNA polymerase sigma-70 factor (ECF subfamily)
MNPAHPDLLLTWIPTSWTQILDGRGKTDAARQARNELLVRYHEAVYQYFARKIRNPHHARELYSNFALKLLETDRVIRHCDPERGRFRNYLKTVLHHMVMDYYRGLARDRSQGLAIDPPGEETDVDFDPVWKQTLLNKAWKALEDSDTSDGQIYFTVLRYFADNPQQHSPEAARELSRRWKRPFTDEAVRTALSRARKRFAQFLLEEVERSLGHPTLDELEAELAQLELLTYCARALAKRRAALAEKGE